MGRLCNLLKESLLDSKKEHCPFNGVNALFFEIKWGEAKVDNFFDNLLLSNEEIKVHDFEKCKKIVEKKVQKYLRSCFKFINLIPPKITANYEMRYEAFTPATKDTTGNYVSKKVDAEIEALEIYSIINQIWERLSYNERVYFTEVLLYKKSENYAIEQMNDITRHLFKQVKESCIIKVAMAFGEDE